MLILPPKQANRFRVEFLLQGKNIDELSMQVVQVDPIRYTPKSKVPVLTTVFEDDIQNRVLKALTSLWDKRLCIKLSVLDGDDNAMMRWTFDDGLMSAFTHGPFDYSLSGAMLLQSEFTCGALDIKVLR